MYIKNDKAVLALLLITLGVLGLFPSVSFAAQEPSPHKTTIKQEFTYEEGDEPDIPGAISQFGDVLRLVSVSDPVKTASLPSSRTYTYRVSGSYTEEQLSQLPPNARLTPVYGHGSRQVDRAETIENLPNNDVDSLPLYKIYTDTDGYGPGGSVSGDLMLAEAKYELVSRDGDGVPDNYTARLIYRGEETYSVILYYDAEATYTSTATAEGESTTYTVVATYEGDAAAEAAPPFADEAGDGPADGTGAGPGGDGTVSSIGDEGAALGGFAFPHKTLSPVGIATIAAFASAALMLLLFGIHEKKKAQRMQAAG
ncbi:MAG: hypothetical protein LBS91_02490 [Clostridiales Family XIII bacterium]|jgi:hypothetical protein|nr:hypothetical protein [Clostridiales Family XIII bacterium]